MKKQSLESLRTNISKNQRSEKQNFYSKAYR